MPRVLALTLLAVAGVWVLDALVGAWLLHQATLPSLLFHPSPDQLATRSVAAVALLALGHAAGSLARRAQQAESVHEDIRSRYETILATTSDAAEAASRDATERHRAEEALGESEARLRRTFKVAPVGIGIARNRVLVEVNDQICEMVGRTRAELVGRDTRVLYPTDEEYHRVAEERERQAETHEIVTLDTLWQHADGHTLNVVMNSSYLDRDDPSRGAIFAATDMTEQIRSRGELVEQHLQLQQAQELAGVGSWAFDFNTDRVTASKEAARIYGLTGESWSIPRVQTVPLPEYREMLDRALADLVKRGKPYDVTFRILRQSDGAIRDIHGVARYDAQRNRAVGVIQDVTDQRSAEEAVRASEARFRSVVEQSSQAIYVLVGDHFELVNPRFCELTGVTAEEACSAEFNFRDLLHPDSRNLIEERRASRLRGEVVSETYEFALRHRSGRRVDVAAAVAVMNYRGQDAVLGFLQDITAQKTLEAKLDQASRMESIGRLSGGVAHDLNNLLSPVLGYAELLMEDLPMGDVRRESAEAILQAGSRARDLVRQLLAFSRQQPMEMDAVDLNAMLGDFDKLLRRTLREDIHTTMVLDADAPEVMADRRQLEQVVMNLAVNAQDAMPEGGVLSIGTELVELGESFVITHPGSSLGHFVALTVRDSGEGMDAETRRRIFEPFFTTKAKGKGTGLGLATVYGIVKQHGGYIEVRSVPGEGTTFTCYFPVTDAPGSSSGLDADEPARPEGSETVLVVEDEELVRNLVVSILGRQGYQVIEAASGEEAVALMGAPDRTVDLLLTDVVLPGMSGPELHHQIRTLSPRTRVLFMSGYTGDVITERGVLTDETFIQKPFSFQVLTNQVRDILDAAVD